MDRLRRLECRRLGNGRIRRDRTAAIRLGHCLPDGLLQYASTLTVRGELRQF